MKKEAGPGGEEQCLRASWGGVGAGGEASQAVGTQAWETPDTGGLWPAKRGQSDSGAVIPGQGGQQVKAGAEAGGGAPLEHRAGPEGWVVASLARCWGSLGRPPMEPSLRGVPRPAGWEGLPVGSEATKERGHVMKGISRNQRFI